MPTHHLRWQSGGKHTVASRGDKITPGVPQPQHIQIAVKISSNSYDTVAPPHFLLTCITPLVGIFQERKPHFVPNLNFKKNLPPCQCAILTLRLAPLIMSNINFSFVSHLYPTTHSSTCARWVFSHICISFFAYQAALYAFHRSWSIAQTRPSTGLEILASFYVIPFPISSNARERRAPSSWPYEKSLNHP